MPDIHKSVLVEHSAARMFDLVDEVEDYPRFLPWCGGAVVSSRSESETAATLHINYHGFKAHFSTVNSKQKPEWMRIRLREGPFRLLEGSWHFIALGPEAAKIEFRLHYEFASRLLEKAFGPVFNHIADTFVDSFVKRAYQLGKQSGER